MKGGINKKWEFYKTGRQAVRSIRLQARFHVNGGYITGLGSGFSPPYFAILQFKIRMLHFSAQPTYYAVSNASPQGMLGYYCLMPFPQHVFMENQSTSPNFFPNFLLPQNQITPQQVPKEVVNNNNTSDSWEGSVQSPFKEQNRRSKPEGRQRDDKQKFGRNITSNIMHLIVKFIRSGKRLRKQVETIIQREGLNIKVFEFYQMLQSKSARLPSYITSKVMERLWKGESGEQRGNKFQKEMEFSKIFRTLGKVYLQNYHLNYVYNSNKIKKASKGLHPAEIRRILAL